MHWPEHLDQPFGDVMNSIKKCVVFNSLQAAEWRNSEIISGDVAHKLTDIKAQDGRDITVSGSATTVRWLLREGLLDELNLLVHPISGRRWPGSALSGGRAEHPARGGERTNLQERRAEPQLRSGQELTTEAGAPSCAVTMTQLRRRGRIDSPVVRDCRTTRPN
jgi:hypothetical protein